MSKKNYIRSIPMSTIDLNALLAGWNVVNSDGLPYPCSLIRMINTSALPIFISYDGATTNEVCLGGGVVELYLEELSNPAIGTCRMQAGTNVYVSGTPRVGYLYLVGYY